MIWRMPVSVIVLVLAAVLALAAALLYGVVGPAPTPAGERIRLPQDARPPGPGEDYRLLLLGTSLTRRGDWPDRLRERLGECAAGPVRVERLARAGAASDWGLAALRERLSRSGAQAPDLVIVEFSGNDAALAHGFPLFMSRRNHLAIIRAARDAGAAVILATMSPAWGWNALERPGQDRYHAIYRDLAASEGVGLVDTIADWRALPAERLRAAVPDDLHPTDEAMAAITVPALAEAVGAILCRR
ncbi:SGNH/GDSL hydrolase family protein [Albidovulum sp.]